MKYITMIYHIIIHLIIKIIYLMGLYLIKFINLILAIIHKIQNFN